MTWSWLDDEGSFGTELYCRGGDHTHSDWTKRDRTAAYMALAMLSGRTVRRRRAADSGSRQSLQTEPDRAANAASACQWIQLPALRVPEAHLIRSGSHRLTFTRPTWAIVLLQASAGNVEVVERRQPERVGSSNLGPVKRSARTPKGVRAFSFAWPKLARTSAHNPSILCARDRPSVPVSRRNAVRLLRTD